MNEPVFPASLKLSIRNRTLDLSTPKVMGILNVTPDSFSDGGRFNGVELALKHVDQMVDEGADLIDIGGESTRPGSDPVTEQQELDRVLPVLEQAVSAHPDILFSVDTTKYTVAEQALKGGAHLINDISGLQKEPRLAGLCAEYEAGYILMHSQGNPKVMQDNPTYDDVVNDLYLFFREKISFARQEGLRNIIIDPGFCFGKTLAHNLELLRNIDAFQDLKCPLMAGASRKSMIGQMLDNRPVDERLIGTVAVHYHALMSGANILRVHDVKEACDSVQIFKAVTSS